MKIIGMRTMPSGDKKVLVWKNYASGAKPTWITAKNLQKHAKDLIDPPEGTTDEYPPIGDINNPENFSGDVGDIKPMPGKSDVPEMGKGAKWIPSQKLKALAKKLKDAGVQPQNTFSKAIAAGEPLPDKFPEPVGMDELPKGEPEEPPPEEPAAPPEAPPEEPPSPEEPEPAPEPEAPPEAPAGLAVTDQDVVDALAGQAGVDLSDLAADATMLTKDQVGMIATAAGQAKDEKDFKKAVQIASTLAVILDKRGEDKASKSWLDVSTQWAAAAGEPAPEPAAPVEPEPGEPEGLTDDEIKGIADSPDPAGLKKLVANADVLGLPQKVVIKKGIEAAATAGEWEKAAALADTMSKIMGSQGMVAGSQKFMADAVKYTAKQSEGAEPEPPPPPPEPTPVDAEEAAAKGLDVYPWHVPLPEDYEVPDAAEAAATAGAMGVAPNEFVHPISGEVMAVTNLEEGEYVDPLEAIILNKEGKQVNKTVVSTGKAVELEETHPAPQGVSATSPLPDPPAPPPDPIPGEQPTNAVEVAKKIPLPKGLPKMSQLTLVGSASHMGGAGTNTIYKDKKGNQYLFKVAAEKGGSKKAKPYSAAAQMIWSQVAQKALGEHINVGVVEVDGSIGTLQPILELDEKQPNFAGNNPKPESLSDEDRKAISREHVLDWLMSQHDSHGGNFIRTKDGRIFSVDKEQGFRYFQADELGTDYHPNSSYGESPPYYNGLWKGFAEGKYDMDPDALAEVINNIQDISTKDYIEMVKPYAETLFPGKPEAQRDFLKQAKRRKLDLRRDWEVFLTKLYRKRTGNDGNFTFDEGFSGEKQSPKGPKVVKKKAKAADYISTFIKEQGGGMNIKTDVYWDPSTPPGEKGTPIPGKITLKCSNTPQAEAKLRELMKRLGVKPLQDKALVGGQYTMFFLDEKAWKDASYAWEEVIQPPKKTDIKPVPTRPRYFPDTIKTIPVKDNAKELANIQNTPTGISGRRYSSDGGQVEGGLMRVRRRRDADGEYFSFQFKLRPKTWKAIKKKGGGTPSTLEFRAADWNEGQDAYVDKTGGYGAVVDSVTSQEWGVGKSKINLVSDQQSGSSSRTSDKYAYVGMVQAKVRPKPGQTPQEALAELIEEMQPGLSKEVLRDPTPKEKEVYRLTQILWAHAPQVADNLKESQRKEPALRALLAEQGIDNETIDTVEFEEVLPGFSTHVQKGRWKKMREKGMLFSFHGLETETIVSVVQRGCLGINERNAAGIQRGNEASYTGDVNTGSGDGVLGYVANNSGGKGPSNYPYSKGIQAIFDPRVLDRLDTYMHYGDQWGTATPYTNGQRSGSIWKNRKPVDDMVEGLGSKTSHEISYRRGVDPSMIVRFVATSSLHREQAIKDLRAAGIQEINGVPIEDMIVEGVTNQQVYDRYVSPMLEESKQYAA